MPTVAVQCPFCLRELPRLGDLRRHLRDEAIADQLAGEYERFLQAHRAIYELAMGDHADR